jgi:hypothetical protein
MRRKPVRRDEVRFDPWRQITTLPVDSVYLDKQLNRKPIRKLWAPLMRQLSRISKKPVEYPHHIQDGAPDCRHCDRRFYRTGYYGFYCSDRCQSLADAPRRAARIAAFVKTRSERRADNRETNCDHCGEPIEAKRSTMRFCSVKCRVAAHRAAPSA